MSKTDTLTHLEAAILRTLVQHSRPWADGRGGYTDSDLAAALEIDPALVTQVNSALAKRGILTTAITRWCRATEENDRGTLVWVPKHFQQARRLCYVTTTGLRALRRWSRGEHT
jgi:DNA-binding MarR family transcriptional regulator